MSNDAGGSYSQSVNYQLNSQLGAMISAAGHLIDLTDNSNVGGKLFGVAGAGVDLYLRTSDEEGFTFGDAVSFIGGVVGGVATGAVTGVLGGNPATVIIGGLVGGATAAGVLDLISENYYFNTPNFTVYNKYTNSDGTRIEEKTYLLGMGSNGAQILQTEQRVYSPDGSFISRQNFRTEVTDGSGTLAQFRALPSAFNPTKCFPADTPIQLASGELVPIQSIRSSDDVAPYYGGGAGDGSVATNGSNATNIAHFRGRGELESRPVVRLFENITDTFIKLSNGLTVTPGHHFLDSKGGFRSIDAILADDSKIALADGTLASVSGEYIHYSAETADMFEQAEGYVAQSVGGLKSPRAANQNTAARNRFQFSPYKNGKLKYQRLVA